MTTAEPLLVEDDEQRPRAVRSAVVPADLAFRAIVRTAALSLLAIMALIGLFLLLRSWTALHKAGWSFLTQQEWNPDANRFGVGTLLVGTVLIALVALAIAVPLALGTALYISEYAPPRLRRPLISAIDLMAAIPSVVYGLWGFFSLQPRVLPLSIWLSRHFGWFPPFAVPNGGSPSRYVSSTFIAGAVVSLMVIPIVCSLTREVFSQAPVGEREAALALGGNRWAMIRTVVLPFGRGGMIGAVMLGMGRALGETVSVYLIISLSFARSFHILESGGSSIAALIAIRFPDSSTFGIAALMAAGLVLFLLTLVVNTIAAAIVARSRSGAMTEI